MSATSYPIAYISSWSHLIISLTVSTTHYCVAQTDTHCCLAYSYVCAITSRSLTHRYEPDLLLYPLTMMHMSDSRCLKYKRLVTPAFRIK